MCTLVHIATKTDGSAIFGNLVDRPRRRASGREARRLRGAAPRPVGTSQGVPSEFLRIQLRVNRFLPVA